MTHPSGSYLGSVRDLKTLRGRCVMCRPVVGVVGDCWGLRSARGRPMARPVIHVYGRGVVRATRVSWEWQHGKPVPDGYEVRVTCSRSDCVRHVEAVPTSVRRAKSGAVMSAHRLATLRRSGQKRSKVSAEQRQWARESGQTATEVAHALGIHKSYASRILRGGVAPGAATSVFTYRP